MESPQAISYDPVSNNLIVNTLNSKGSWLALRVSQENQASIEAIQNFVQESLLKEGVKDWKPYPMERMHISLFRGFTAKLTEEKFKHVLRTIALFIIKNKVLKHAVKIDLSHSSTTIIRGPGPYVTLHFSADYLKKINAIFRNELIKLHDEKVLSQEELCDEAKLYEELRPHLTLGIISGSDALERDPEKQNPQVKILNNPQASSAFYERFREAQKDQFKSSRLLLPIVKLELLGLSESTDPTQKNYSTLAAIELDRIEPTDAKTYQERAFRIHLEGVTTPVDGTNNLRTTFKTKLLLNAYVYNSSRAGLIHSAINLYTISIDVSQESYRKTYDHLRKTPESVAP